MGRLRSRWRVTHLNLIAVFARRFESGSMDEGHLIFTPLSDTMDRKEFGRCLNLHPIPRASHGMTARDQFLAMLFARLTFRESQRGIEARLRGSGHLYAMGIRSNITRTNLADANEHRWQIELFFKWIQQNLRFKVFYGTTENAAYTQI